MCATSPSTDGMDDGRQVLDGHWRLGGIVGLDGLGDTSPFGYELVVSEGSIAKLNPADTQGYGHELGQILVPLLVNGHDHGRGRGNVLAGVPDAPLEEWLATLRQAGPKSQADLVGQASRQMLAGGVGASVFCVNAQGPNVAAEVADAAEAAIDAGIRAAIVFPLADAREDIHGRSRDAQGWRPDQRAAQLAEVEDLARRFANTTVEVQLGPLGPQWVSESTLRSIGDHARRHGRRVHMHLLESRVQREWADRTYPDGLIKFLDSCGLLGPHVCLAHGTQLRDDELALIAATGSVLTLNASSNLRLASGIPPIAGALSGRGTLAAGLDGLALGDDHDYWNELRLLRGLAQGQSGSHPDAGKLLARLTAGGRQALGQGAPPTPAVGGSADFLIIDLGDYCHLWTSGSWALPDVVYAASRPERVQEVWVAGRRVFSREVEPIPPRQSSGQWDAAQSIELEGTI